MGTVAKFISATHIGIKSNPSFGGVGAMGLAPRASTARASFPDRSMMEVKSYFINLLLCCVSFSVYLFCLRYQVIFRPSFVLRSSQTHRKDTAVILATSAGTAIQADRS